MILPSGTGPTGFEQHINGIESLDPGSISTPKFLDIFNESKSKPETESVAEGKNSGFLCST